MARSHASRLAVNSCGSSSPSLRTVSTHRRASAKSCRAAALSAQRRVLAMIAECRASKLVARCGSSRLTVARCSLSTYRLLLLVDTGGKSTGFVIARTISWRSRAERVGREPARPPRFSEKASMPHAAREMDHERQLLPCAAGGVTVTGSRWKVRPGSARRCWRGRLPALFRNRRLLDCFGDRRRLSCHNGSSKWSTAP
jgi:hypothetical protein